jgi:hypothetical protein
LISKLNKDITKKESYRPISLRIIDANFFTKYVQIKFNNTLNAGTIVHACNPNYLGVKNRRILSLIPA